MKCEFRLKPYWMLDDPPMAEDVPTRRQLLNLQEDRRKKVNSLWYRIRSRVAEHITWLREG
jgi:hypothetical protein